MKVAFPHWNQRIAPVFDTASLIQVIEVESGQVVGEIQEQLADAQSLEKALQLVELEINTLVCGAISRPMRGLIVAYGIEVIPFVAGDLRQVIEAWLGGTLHDRAYAMPGCCSRGRGRAGGTNNNFQEVDMMNGRGGGRGAGGGKGQGPGNPRGGRLSGSLAAGPTGYCVCPQCGQKELHERGVPCVMRQCPKCGITMTR